MLSNYIGQDEAVAQLRAEMTVAKATGRPLPNMLLLGEPGTGKTTLAQRMAEDMGLPFAIMHCPNVSDRSEVAAKIIEAQGGILFCEEIHALRRDFAEDMYTVIDDNTVTMLTPEKVTIERETIDPNETDFFEAFKTVTVEVETGKMLTTAMKVTPLTVVGATTDEAMLAPAFLSRLSGLVVRLAPYSLDSLMSIAENHAFDAYGIALSWEAGMDLAARSRLNPRRVKQLVDRAYAHAHGSTEITEDHAMAAIEAVGIDRHGLEAPHRKMLGFLAESNGLSRTSLAQRMGIPAKNVDLYFGELVRLGFATIGRKHEITPSGRQAIG